MKNIYKDFAFEKPMDMRKNNKGQAAIEFLMTYGWMLLVVLIVGALIFSFVDFGSLLPNKLDLTNSFRGDAQRVVASADTDQFQFVVRYVGARANQIDLDTTPPVFNPIGGKTCAFTNITDAGGNPVNSGSVSFVNGQESVFSFDCSDAGSGLIESDVLEGDLTIKYSDPRTAALTLVSSGDIRVTITE
jgi:hypothetical protein